MAKVKRLSSTPEAAKQLWNSLQAPTDGVVAKMLGVDRTTIGNWRRGGWAYRGKGNPSTETETCAVAAAERLVGTAAAAGLNGGTPPPPGGTPPLPGVVVGKIAETFEEDVEVTLARILETVRVIAGRAIANADQLLIDKGEVLPELLKALAMTAASVQATFERTVAMAAKPDHPLLLDMRGDLPSDDPMRDAYAEFKVITGQARRSQSTLGPESSLRHSPTIRWRKCRAWQDRNASRPCAYPAPAVARSASGQGISPLTEAAGRSGEMEIRGMSEVAHLPTAVEEALISGGATKEMIDAAAEAWRVEYERSRADTRAKGAARMQRLRARRRDAQRAQK
jgi:hypothetical protein